MQHAQDMLLFSLGLFWLLISVFICQYRNHSGSFKYVIIPVLAKCMWPCLINNKCDSITKQNNLCIIWIISVVYSIWIIRATSWISSYMCKTWDARSNYHKVARPLTHRPLPDADIILQVHLSNSMGQMRKIEGCACAENTGDVFPTTAG